jgi:hypothetical protein
VCAGPKRGIQALGQTSYREPAGVPPLSFVTFMPETDPHSRTQITATQRERREGRGDIATEHRALFIASRNSSCHDGYGSAPWSLNDGKINDWGGGRGVYFKEPNGHVLELMTVPQ